ncbi:MAG TPA: glycerol-3-phosphate 1-O-acyltransferase PlsY [Candidatus Dormibacteraeota bacterium]|jgi:glycerol-3-phosphate acyltransferase PlsY|nr:glycerol-3-phosphate 1-O-acyltransferase PlsY [Candidatus Dormibacteraeota bacterium]
MRRQTSLRRGVARRLGGATVAAGAGYLIGSIPFGLLLGRAVRGLDVRDLGSGSIGTTNVLRAVGPGAAVATFALDVGKGAAAIRCARALDAGPAGEVTAGIAAMVGHSWPVFAGFRGGKSVATAFGVLLEVSPEASGWALAGGLTALTATRTMSVASLVAAGSATVGAGVATARGGDVAPLVFAGMASALIVVRHSANVRRLLRGLEPRVSLPRTAA